MHPIENYSHLLENIKNLDSIFDNKNSRHYSEYLSLIRKGKVFLPYVTQNSIRFGPSRFLGYANNTVPTHLARKDKNGWDTTPRIRLTLRDEYKFMIYSKEDVEIDCLFQEFCSSLGITPDNGKRSYWVTPDVANWLEKRKIAEQSQESLEAQVLQLEMGTSLPKTTREAIIMARLGQGIFRRRVLQAYNDCMVTGIKDHKILIASHIKPWRLCYKDPNECLSHDNALLLSPTWDKLFDIGLISFSTSGKLLVSKKLSKSSCKHLGVEKVSIALTNKQAKFMQHHRALHGFDDGRL